MVERIVGIPTFGEGGLQSAINPRFGRCDSFTFVKIVNNEISSVNVVSNAAAGAMGGAGIQAGQTLGIEDYTEVPVRAEDVDFMSIVHFNEYLNYFDFGFVSITSKLNFNVFESVKNGIVFPVKKVEIEYTNSAIFGDIIKIHSRLLKIG
ncbi:unnamed protein product, partial [marine sediment metagenome]